MAGPKSKPDKTAARKSAAAPSLPVAWIAAGGVMLLALAALLFMFLQPDAVRSALREADMDAPAHYVGSEVCATCEIMFLTCWIGWLLPSSDCSEGA